MKSLKQRFGNFDLNLPLNFDARVPSTDDNFPIDSLVFRSNCVRDVLANFISMLYVQHVPVVGLSQYLKTISEMKNEQEKRIN